MVAYGWPWHWINVVQQHWIEWILNCEQLPIANWTGCFVNVTYHIILIFICCEVWETFNIKWDICKRVFYVVFLFAFVSILPFIVAVVVVVATFVVVLQKELVLIIDFIQSFGFTKIISRNHYIIAFWFWWIAWRNFIFKRKFNIKTRENWTDNLQEIKSIGMNAVVNELLIEQLIENCLFAVDVENEKAHERIKKIF